MGEQLSSEDWELEVAVEEMIGLTDWYAVLLRILSIQR